MKSKIYIERGQLKKIAEAAKTCTNTARSALNGKVKNALHVRIREIAKQMGGIEID